MGNEITIWNKWIETVVELHKLDNLKSNIPHKVPSWVVVHLLKRNIPITVSAV